MPPLASASTSVELDTQVANSRYKTDRFDSVTETSDHDCHDRASLIGLNSAFCFDHAVAIEMKQDFSITGGDFEVSMDGEAILCCKGVFWSCPNRVGMCCLLDGVWFCNRLLIMHVTL